MKINRVSAPPSFPPSGPSLPLFDPPKASYLPEKAMEDRNSGLNLQDSLLEVSKNKRIQAQALALIVTKGLQ